MVARLFDLRTKMWTNPPYGVTCKCVEDFVWPSAATSLDELGSVKCEIRGKDGLNEYNKPCQLVPVESLVLASEWILVKHANGLTVRGCPVAIGGVGSPLAVIVETPNLKVFVSGSVMEMELLNPERYKKGKERVSVLIVGFYCTKRLLADGACYHVSVLKFDMRV